MLFFPTGAVKIVSEHDCSNPKYDLKILHYGGQRPALTIVWQRLEPIPQVPPLHLVCEHKWLAFLCAILGAAGEGTTSLKVHNLTHLPYVRERFCCTP